MWRKIGKAIGIFVGWCVIVAYLAFAAHITQEDRATQKVEKVVVSLPDSSAQQRFTSSAQILKLIKRKNIRMKGVQVDSLDAVEIAKTIESDGYVRKADVYVASNGKLYIDVYQHKPVMRMMCGGRDSYITEEGHIFRSPQGSSCYTAVMTGCYRPQFPRNYQGLVGDYYRSRLDKIDEEAEALAKDISMLRREQVAYTEKINESDDDEAKNMYREKLAALNDREESIKARQPLVAERRQKLEKRRDDFENLLQFVSDVQEDTFWSAEIVQFVADTTFTGEISLRLVPRSGNFVVEFGTLNRKDEKLDKLRGFYDKGLQYMGWDRYKIVDIRYDKQIICTE